METNVSIECGVNLRCKAKTNQSMFLCRNVVISMYQRRYFYMQCYDRKHIRRRGGFLLNANIIDELGIFINDGAVHHHQFDLTANNMTASFVTASNGNKVANTLELYKTENYVSFYPVVQHGKRRSIYRMDVPSTDIIRMCNFIKEWSLYYATH